MAELISLFLSPLLILAELGAINWFAHHWFNTSVMALLS